MANKTLNIKDPEVHRMASEIAERTGESLTHVVKKALREQLERLESQQGKATIEELLAIAQRIAVHEKRPYQDHSDLLYDEHGLPK